jgi:hypothetical protein
MTPLIIVLIIGVVAGGLHVENNKFGYCWTIALVLSVFWWLINDL